ncbi:hypothetical protein K1W69_26515 [Hoeflea sp. WL0058]|uniref:Uncharacterized protein n=1 Tax=Flavimaribacter sediminis TaxID=2865987 RepID=A0AAE2ZQ85_9HYPH|nr:hypothetical protein [Flavimaribacter sediminis]MBW8640773.1 hypothetical protein [Flavimaribacter sediminis]
MPDKLMQYSHGAGQYDRSFNVENSGSTARQRGRHRPFANRAAAESAVSDVIDAEFVHIDDNGSVVEVFGADAVRPVSPGDFFERRAHCAGQGAGQAADAAAPAGLPTLFGRLDRMSPVGFGALVGLASLCVFWFFGGYALLQ